MSKLVRVEGEVVPAMPDDFDNIGYDLDDSTGSSSSLSEEEEPAYEPETKRAKAEPVVVVVGENAPISSNAAVATAFDTQDIVRSLICPRLDILSLTRMRRVCRRLYRLCDHPDIHTAMAAYLPITVMGGHVGFRPDPDIAEGLHMASVMGSVRCYEHFMAINAVAPGIPDGVHTPAAGRLKHLVGFADLTKQRKAEREKRARTRHAQLPQRDLGVDDSDEGIDYIRLAKHKTRFIDENGRSMRIHMAFSEHVALAISNGHLEFVRYIFQMVSSKRACSYLFGKSTTDMCPAFAEAVLETDSVPALKMLLEVFDPPPKFDEWLMTGALVTGKLECVKFLWPRITSYPPARGAAFLGGSLNETDMYAWIPDVRYGEVPPNTRFQDVYSVSGSCVPTVGDLAVFLSFYSTNEHLIQWMIETGIPNVAQRRYDDFLMCSTKMMRTRVAAKLEEMAIRDGKTIHWGMNRFQKTISLAGTRSATASFRNKIRDYLKFVRERYPATPMITFVHIRAGGAVVRRIPEDAIEDVKRETQIEREDQENEAVKHRFHKTCANRE